MTDPRIRLHPGLADLVRLSGEEIPQKDDLCGAFWGLAVLRSLARKESDSELLDQDAVAAAAGTLVASMRTADSLPMGAVPRHDFRLAFPRVDEVGAGTSAAGLARAIERLSGGTLAVVPAAGPWTSAAVLDVLEIAVEVALAPPIANLRTGRLAGSQPEPETILGYLLGSDVSWQAPDWDVGHFVLLGGSVEAASDRALVLVGDTYAILGWRGFHLQPVAAVAAALRRDDGYEGGVLLCCSPARREEAASRLERTGLETRLWDNGTPYPGPASL